MSSCNQPNNTCADTPIGSPPPSACTPCPTALTEESAVGYMKQILERLCAIESRVNNWELLLNRARNRLSELENRPVVRQSSQRVSLDLCSNEGVDEVDALAGCVAGASAKLTLEECYVPVGIAGGKVGSIQLGATYLEAAVTLKAAGTYGNNSNYNYSMSSYDRPQCANRALVRFIFTLGTDTGGPAVSSLSYEFNSGVNAVCGYLGPESGGRQYSAGIVSVPIIGEQISFKTTKEGNYGTANLGLYLIGFEP